MSATVAAALKKLSAVVLSDKKNLKTAVGIIIGIIVIIVMPIAAVLSIFSGDMNIDTDRLQQMITESLTSEEEDNLKFIEDTMLTLDEKMTAAGFPNRVKEAQVLYVLELSDYSREDGFTDQLVDCFADNQTDEQLILSVLLSAFSLCKHLIGLLILCNQAFGNRQNIFVRSKLFLFCLPELYDQIARNIVF